VDAKPAEADNAEVDKDVDENRWVNVAEVEDDEDYEADDPDDKEGGDPDEGGVDEVVVGGADADDEEGAGGERDGGQDEAEDALPNVNFSVNLSIFPRTIFPWTIIVCRYVNLPIFPRTIFPWTIIVYREMRDEKSREGNVEQVKDEVDDPQRQTSCFQRAAAASLEYEFFQHLEALDRHRQ